MWDRRPRRSTVLLMGPGQMIAGMTKRSHSCAGGNPVLANVIPLDSRRSLSHFPSNRYNANASPFPFLTLPPPPAIISNARSKVVRKEVQVMTQYIEEASRKTPVAAQYEVIVVGGGTSGVTAAIACARQGIDTLIVEQFGYLGGSQTAALVMPMMPINVQGTSSVGGINDEIRERLMATGDAGMEPGGNDGWFNPEMLKYVLDDLCLEAGVEILYHTTLADVVMEGDQVCGIVVQCKSGRQAILARRVIDATADADVSVLAGAPFEAGRPEDGLNQAMSLRFNMGGIDYDRFVEFLNEKSPDRKYFWPFVETAHTPDKERPLSYLFRQAEAAGELQEGDAVYFQMFSIPGRPGEASFNCPRIFDRVKGYSTDDLTYAQIVGRQKIRRLANFCRKYFPGFENAFISQTAPMVGVRETRRIVGEYVFSGEDVSRAAQP